MPRYMIYYPPGQTSLNGETKDNRIIAEELLNALYGDANIAFCWTGHPQWKVLQYVFDRWVEISPKYTGEF